MIASNRARRRLDVDGRPDFHRLSARMPHAAPRVAVTLFVFDVLPVEGSR